MKDTSPIVKDLLTSGLEARASGALPEAKTQFQAALVEAKRIRDFRGEASALLYLAGVLRVFDKDLLNARKLLKECLRICERISFGRGGAYAMMELGTIAYQEGKPEEGLNWLSRTLTEFEKQQDKKGKAAALHQMGLIEKYKKDFDSAERRFRESLMIFESFSDKYSMGQVLLSLGDVSINYHNDLEYGKQLFSKALEFFEETGSRHDVEKAKQNLSALQKLIEGNNPQ
jgi:tetratricopeptide (TPR) repeat protein